MTTSRKLLCITYAAIAVGALVATWSQNLAYMSSGSQALMATFWQDTRVNPASRSITADIALFMLAAVFFMVVEARRHQIRWVWAYVIGGMFTAISFTFPLFLIARERKMAASETPDLPILDKVLLNIFAVAVIAFTVWVDCGH